MCLHFDSWTPKLLNSDFYLFSFWTFNCSFGPYLLFHSMLNLVCCCNPCCTSCVRCTPRLPNERRAKPHAVIQVAKNATKTNATKTTSRQRFRRQRPHDNADDFTTTTTTRRYDSNHDAPLRQQTRDDATTTLIRTTTTTTTKTTTVCA
jgi:hypothetical protein